MNFSSISSPITVISPPSRARSKSAFFTSLNISVFSASRLTVSACSGGSCAPSLQYTLYPLYSLGLCEAVMFIPAVQPSSRTAKERQGVG